MKDGTPGRKHCRLRGLGPPPQPGRLALRLLWNPLRHRRLPWRSQMSLIAFLIIGLLAGLLARALMPGPQPMGLLGTMALGCAGSFIGGMIGSFFAYRGSWLDFHPSGLIWSTL